MWNNGHDAYLESRVMTADPVELINLLYQACTQSVRDARAHLAGGLIAERSRAITKACAIVSELAFVLDHERGGEISQRLALLYDYIHRRLIAANMEQSDAPLAEVLGLLATLSEGWAGVRAAETPAPQPPAPADSPWSQSVAQESAYGTQTIPANSPWSQSVAQESAYGTQTIPVDSPWSQPIAQESAYGMQDWSL